MRKFFKFFFVFLIFCFFLWLFLFKISETSVFLSKTKLFFINLFDVSNCEFQSDLYLENQKLKAELFFEKGKRDNFNETRYKIAYIFSRFPFNERNSVVINIGSDSGVKKDMPVLAKEGILLGKIKDVKKTQSEVETFWDASWKTSVSIGEKKIKAIIEGGATPSLNLIPKDANISEGDFVVNASPEFPLGVFLGSVKNVTISNQEAWKRAEILTNFHPEELDQVLVVFDFP